MEGFHKFGPLTLEVWYRTEYPAFMRLSDPPAPSVRHETWSVGAISSDSWQSTIAAAVEAGLLPFVGPDKVREWYEAIPAPDRAQMDMDIRPMVTVQGRPRLVPRYEHDSIHRLWRPRVFEDRPGADYDAWLRGLDADREREQADLAAAADRYEAAVIRSQSMIWLH